MTTIDTLRVAACTAGDVPIITATEPAGSGYAVATFAGQASGRCLYLVAWIGGEPVGSGELEWAEVPELKNLHVRERHRSKGVGAAVIGAAQVAAGARGADAVEIGVGTDNPDARRLYERLGYRPTGRSETYTYEYVDASGERCTATETAEYVRLVLAHD